MIDGKKKQLAVMHNMTDQLDVIYAEAQKNNVPGDILNRLLDLKRYVKDRRNELVKEYNR